MGEEQQVNFEYDPNEFSYSHAIKKYEELQAAHDNLAQQLSTANNLLEIAVEALLYYARNTDKFINWRAKKALKEIEG